MKSLQEIIARDGDEAVAARLGFSAVYMRHIQAGPKNDALFREPENPGKGNGYFHVSKETGLAVILGKGPLDSTEAREAKDAKYGE